MTAPASPQGLERWERRYGAEAAEAIARAALEEPEKYVRIGPAGARRQKREEKEAPRTHIFRTLARAFVNYTGWQTEWYICRGRGASQKLRGVEIGGSGAVPPPAAEVRQHEAPTHKQP